MPPLTDLPGWSQNSRLLTLHTPLGPDKLLAETATIDEALGPVGEHAGYRIELTALSADARILLTALLGQPVRLDLQTSASRTELRPFHGHVTAIAKLGANGGFARYRLTIEPWLAFLGYNQDNYLFQDKSVIQIIDELLGDWAGQGKLAPAWRWNLADSTVYPQRGMTVQYQESDLAFLKRLLAEEGLFCWFEHAKAEDGSLGTHTLVIADHNGVFTANPQNRIRYTQAGSTLGEDSLDRWHGRRRLDTTESNAASWDYRSLSSRRQSAHSAIDNGNALPAAAWHDPGQYAWQDNVQGERMLLNQRQAIDARLKQTEGEGTVRSAAPGTTFHLADHPEHASGQGDDDHFLITAVHHRARNNLAEQLPGAFDALGPGDTGDGGASLGRPFDEPVAYYRNRLIAQRAAIPWRPLFLNTHGRHIHPRPTVRGTLTGIVVGNGSPTHTDRDGRIRVQFPWQRGSRGASSNPHPTGSDNATGDASLGVWLRVVMPVAGSNWGGHLIPRPGQEVTVDFLNGNIDRPLVTGALYNGQGNDDAPGNRIAGNALNATANAPAWFAGKEGEHAHGAALSGLKTQQLATSQSGGGGYNQLVFDDTPGESRIEFSTTQYRSGLQLGHLKQQTDNARQKDRGHGGELVTQAALALRAGAGLLLSTDVRPNAGGTQLDSTEAIARLDAARQLSQGLADLAGKQNAALKGDPEQLPANQSLEHAREVLETTESRGPAQVGGSQIKATQGGTGTVPAWSEPRIQTSAPGGIAQLTPANHILVSGTHTTFVSEHDSQLISQGSHALAGKDGLALFAHGKSKKDGKPNQETGIHLHAAAGKVSLQAQSGKIAAAADKKVTFASTQADLQASAKQKILATAGGAYLKLEGGNIELHAPGKVEFKASMKNWAGPKSSSNSASLPKAKDLLGCAKRMESAAASGGAV